MGKRGFLIGVLLLFISLNTVYAQSGDDPPNNPGSGDDQDISMAEGVNWIFPEYGATWVDMNDPSIDVSLDWSSLAVAGKIKTEDDHYVFVGLDSTSSSYILDDEAHDEYHPGQGEGEGFAFGLGHLKRLAGCDTVWVEPGEIIATAEKTAPEYPVVISQDPDSTGVGLIWEVQISPTIVRYEHWGKLGKVHACVSDTDPDDILEMECTLKNNGHFDCREVEACPEGYSKTHTQLWGCMVDHKEYREGIEMIKPGANLTAQSRDWILGPLAVAFPGTYLKHPNWEFSPDYQCQWLGNTCLWVHEEAAVGIEDPGWYDLVLTGMTTGTPISPPRSFTFIAGNFGVYLIDSSQVQ